MKWYAFVATAVAVALFASNASAVVLEDFEGAWGQVGLLMADPADATNQILYLAGGEFVEIELPDAGPGTLTVDVYDPGLMAENTDDVQGPRWGVGGTDHMNNAVMAALMSKPWLPGNEGYAWTPTPGGDNYPDNNNGPSSIFNWFSPDWFRGPRQVEAWMTWTFEIGSDELVTISVDFWTGSKTTTEAMPGGGQYFVACGGSASSQTIRWQYNGFGIDNVTWEPASVPQLDGDANGDGTVNLEDFVALKNNFGATTGATWEMGDFNGDGAVNLEDFVILKNNFGATL